MKISLFILMAALNFTPEAFARSGSELRTTWYCPADSRGEMPKQKTVRLSYSDSGVLEIKPNIFNLGGVDNFFKRIFNGRRDSTSVNECLQTFLQSLEAPLNDFRRQNCSVTTSAICRKSTAQLTADLQGAIRDTEFYRRYEPTLTAPAPDSAGSSNGTTVVTTDNTTPDPIVVTRTATSGGGVLGNRTVTVTTGDPETTPRRRSIFRRAIDLAGKVGGAVGDAVEEGFNDLTGRNTTPNPGPDPVRTTTVVDPNPNPNPNPDPETVVTTDNGVGSGNTGDQIQQRVDPPRRTPVVVRTTPEGDEETRARLLDLMIDNADLFSNNDTKLFAQLCPQLGSTTGVNQDWCRWKYTQTNRVLARTAQLLGEIKQRPVSERQALTAVACLPQRSDFSDIENILGAIDAKEDCDDLNPGEYKSGPYLLKRTPEGNYEAMIKVKFNHISGNLNGPQMQQKINDCMTQLAPYMRGPGGETLTVRVLSEEDAMREYRAYEQPKTASLNLLEGIREGTEGPRGNSANLNDTMGCSTLAHEFLHHLGLWDEYHEQSTHVNNATLGLSMADEYACRVIPKKNTIMASNVSAVASVVPQIMNCRCNNDQCRQGLRLLSSGDQNIYELLAAANPTDIVYQGGNIRCVSTQIDADARNYSEPNRRSIVLSQSASNFSFEMRQVYQQSGGAISNAFRVNRFRLDCSCSKVEGCAEEIASKVAKLRENQVAQTCPWGFTNSGSAQYSREGLIAGNQRSGVEGDTLRLVTRPTATDSLLAPNHMNRIIYRNCQTGPAAEYNRCSSFAYIPLNDPRCTPDRDRCDDETYLGFGE